MKKIKYSQLLICLGVVAMLLSSCNDFLDREPLDRVGPNQFLNSENDLSSFPINYYGLFSTHGGWNTGIGRGDDHTDNQATADANLSLYEPGYRLVPTNGDFGLGNIRAFNFFLGEVLPKRAAGTLTGNTNNIDHYIGEVYMLRAMAYFSRLKTYGDFPIITTVLPDQEEVLIEAGKRAPRNMVARQIISDLDSAILLLNTSMSNKTRITRDAALLAKSRVALYEASYLTYHRGTPRVPGEPGWPGANMSYNSGFSINLDQEIDYFLDQAMDASKQVADRIALTENSGVLNPPTPTSYSGWNPYWDMFSARNMGTFPEILFWRQYDLSLQIAHGVTIYIERGGNTGLTKGFVEGFLMKNGLPIYAPGSGYQGDVFISDVKEDRDERLQLFMYAEGDPIHLKHDSAIFQAPLIINLKEVRDVTGYRSRKFLSYEPDEAPGSDLTATAGSPIFRAAEAYLNYIEASYMKKGVIDADADRYWKEIRTRAGVDPDYNKTIAATDMSIEALGDWGAYSGGTLIDPTLYNIRRERRSEFVSEAMRYDDLMRWRAMDQVENYVIEGFNLWDEAYKNSVYTDPQPGEAASAGLIDDGTSNANVSNSELSKYLRPYQILNLSTNTVFDGYTWTEANYLAPVPYRQMQLTSPDGSAENSNFYQNPYWPVEANAQAIR